MRQREKDLRPDADVDAEMAHVLEIMRDEVHDTIKTLVSPFVVCSTARPKP